MSKTERNLLVASALTALVFMVLIACASPAHGQTIGVPGTAAPIKAEQIAGTDGTNLRAIKTDSSGNQVVVGPTGASSNQVQGTNATGTAPVGNPLMVGWDGTNSRLLKTDTAGDLATVAAVADADGIANNPAGQTVSPTGTAGPLEINNHIFNGTTWDRLRGDTTGMTISNINSTLADATSNSTKAYGTIGGAAIQFQSLPFVFNGATWDRIRGNTDGLFIGKNASDADGVANTAAYPQANAAGGLKTYPAVFNGTTWDREPGDTKGVQVHGTRNGFNCVVPVSTATTIQAVAAGCAAPGASLSLYITDIEFGSSAAGGTAADSFPTLKSGTGGTCGTATAVIWQAMIGANAQIVANLSTPIKVAANSEVCWIMSTAGSKTVQVHGFIAP